VTWKCGRVQADAANLLSAAVASAHRDGFQLGIPGVQLRAVVDAARLPPAEPASHEAMRLLCLIGQDFSAASYPDSTASKREQRRGSAADPSASSSNGVEYDAGPHGSGGEIVRAVLAELGAAMVAFAHLQHFPQSLARGGSHDAPRLTRGFVARFLCWVCKEPEVFRDLRDRGLLESLVDILRSSKGDERADSALAVATLITRHLAAAVPLRALGAITPLVEHVKVRPDLHKCQHFATHCQWTLLALFVRVPTCPVLSTCFC
jgi:hypothetical protein